MKLMNSLEIVCREQIGGKYCIVCEKAKTSI